VSAGAPAALAPLANSAAPSPANLRPTLTLPDLQAVVDRIALQAKPGIQRISFQVEPPELGRLTIQLTMRGGRLHGVINADSGEVASMLRDGIEVVRQSMGRSGLDVASFEIKSETQNNPEHRDSASPFESQNDHSPKPRSHRQESRASGNAAADGAANDKKQPTKLTVENSLTSDSSTPSLDMVI
ncbi:MAG: flagellar hook-length control protein FliK, partial [Planctomycetota bacterium]